MSTQIYGLGNFEFVLPQMCETEGLEWCSVEKLTVNLPATELHRHLQQSQARSWAQLPATSAAKHPVDVASGTQLLFNPQGTHLCVCKGAPRLAAFLYVLCQVNK